MPYAAKAIITHKFITDHLDLYIEFRHPMQRTAIPQASPPVYDWYPPLVKWLLECDGSPIAITASVWLDPYTLLLTSATVLALPDKVTLEYDGPDEHLCTTWGKQWEPWGAIISLEGWPTTFKTGMIILWHGSIVSIPSGWHLCDGTSGTPDLRNRFIVGAGSTYAPGATGGAVQHEHSGDTDISDDFLSLGTDIAAGTDYINLTDGHSHFFTAWLTNHLPPYYALCYIMKL